jgi:uncharacterized peroxidase-related enzyme
MLRLSVLERGHAWPHRLLISFLERLSRVRADDVLRTFLYRPRFFGRSFLHFGRSVMRGPSEWTAGERELFAARVSRLNECPFCVGIHTQTATLGLTRAIDVAFLDGWRGAGLDQRTAAAFELLESRVADPEAPTQGDIDQARRAGLSDDAILDVLYVAFLFDLINRLANAFGFISPTEDGRLKNAAVIHRLGYRFPDFLLR